MMLIHRGHVSTKDMLNRSIESLTWNGRDMRDPGSAAVTPAGRHIV